MGCGQCLRVIFSGTKQKSEKLLDRGALFRRETLTAQTNHIQSGDAIGAHGHAEVRDVLAKTAIALNHTRVANANKLVKHGSSTDEGIVPEMDVTSQDAMVGQDVFVPELHIMREMNTDHEEVPFPQPRGAAGRAAAMNGDVLADHIARPHDDTALGLGPET